MRNNFNYATTSYGLIVKYCYSWRILLNNFMIEIIYIYFRFIYEWN
jgi:hypothetical protein